MVIIPKMESLKPNVEVRQEMATVFRTLTSSTEENEILTALQTLQSYLDEGADSKTSSVQRAEFRRAHFTRTLQLLISRIQADWFHSLTAAQQTELWDGLFLRGPPEQVLLVLMEGIGDLRWVLKQEGCKAYPLFVYTNFTAADFPSQTQRRS